MMKRWQELIHDKAVRARAHALLLGALAGYAGWLAIRTDAMPNATSAHGWLSTFFFILALALIGLGTWTWKTAGSTSVPPTLPDARTWRGPNRVTLTTRVSCLVVSLAVLAYGTAGLIANDIYLPGRRGSGMHFYGVSAWLAFGAITCAAIGLLSVIADHYDRRNNELAYAHALALSQWGSSGMLAAAFGYRMLVS